MVGTHTRSFIQSLFQSRLAWLLVFSVLLLPVCQKVLTAVSTAQQRPEPILLNSGALDISRQTAKLTLSGEKRLRLIQFAGAIQPAWYQALLASGAEIVNYIPNNAYLIYADADSVESLQAWNTTAASMHWLSDYLPQMKLSRSAAQPSVSAEFKDNLFAIQLVRDDAANQTTLNLLKQVQLIPAKQQTRIAHFINLIVALPSDAVAEIAERDDVISITRYSIPKRLDERQDQIVAGNISNGLPVQGDYLDYLSSKGFTQAQFTASNFVVNVSDSGIDNATSSPNHFALYTGGSMANASRVVYNRMIGTPSGPGSTLLGCDGHGTINSHIIAGFIPSGAPFNAFPHADASGFRHGLGVAPFVKVGSSVIFDNSTNFFGDYTFPDFVELESRAYNDRARISSNSWGGNTNGEYNIDAQLYDYLTRDAQPDGAVFSTPGNQELVTIFAAGNSGPQATSVAPPAAAKNTLSVGASESVNQFGGPDKCTTADSEADNANDLSIFTSRGPTMDGRRKPEIVAPGTHVTGGVLQVPNPPANGQADPCFIGQAVCGGPPSSPNFFPIGQQFYTASSGTSHATPAVSGAAALARQRFLNEGLAAPSPAMTKAALVNTARYMTGTDANDTLWSNVQGMGAVNLNSFFELFTVPTLLRDQDPVDVFTASGQVRTINGTISNSSKPFRVTLAWTDAPGSTTGAAWVNNLDLEVTIGGQTYRGNNFGGAFSIPGGVADDKNNLESVLIPAGVSGAFTIRIIAANIAGDGVPNNAALLDQDYALVVFNMAEALQPIVDAAGGTLAAETCLPADGAIDPGENVTVNFTLKNIGRTATTNLTATLLPGGNVVNPSASQTYGAIAPLGGTATRAFSFRASGSCGGQLSATMQLQDGNSSLGLIVFIFPLGVANLQTQTFSNTTSISVPTFGASTPYPSTINVADMSGTVSKITVTIQGMAHTNPDDFDILLSSPDGRRILLMSDVGGGGDISGVNLIFDDAAASLLDNSATITSGTYKPTNFGVNDVLSAPAPAGPYADPPQLSTFNGASPNGDWSLWVYDDLNGNSGQIAGGWSLTLTTYEPVCCIPPACPTITVFPATIASGTVGAMYSQTFAQSGGTLPVTFSLSGTLPNGLALSTAGVLSGIPTESGGFPIIVTATDFNGCTGSNSYTLTIAAPVNNGLQFYPLAAPVRLLDTRVGASGCDAPGAMISGGTSRTQTAAGRTCGGLTIPANAKALTGNITTVESGGGFLTLYPSGVTRPLVANSNFAANQILNNVFTVALGASDGAFNIFVTTNTNVVVDITGYYAPPSASGLYFHPLPKPVRLMDTRAGQTACFTPGAQLTADSTTTQLGTTTCDGVLIPAGAQALVGNATTVSPQANGFLTLFPADASRPLVASSNFQTGINMNAPFTVGLSPSGEFNIYTASATNLVIDVLGYFTAQLSDSNGQGLLFNPLPTPVRLLDTRAGQTGCFTPGAQMIGGTGYLQPATGVCTGIPAAAKAVVGNATTVNVSANGFLTFWPSNASQPLVAASNYRSSTVFNRHFTVGLGTDGAFKRFTSTTTDLVIDLVGYFAP
ncbi:MAG: S8 family serine peptidase [Acidobacteria bacterium]|nr:S8 family serine peptidase [Acidobacteriota bacterium]